jgi:hypothetical protein
MVVSLLLDYVVIVGEEQARLAFNNQLYQTNLEAAFADACSVPQDQVRMKTASVSSDSMVTSVTELGPAELSFGTLETCVETLVLQTSNTPP